MKENVEKRKERNEGKLFIDFPQRDFHGTTFQGLSLTHTHTNSSVGR
jgi:hypothetical protein